MDMHGYFSLMAERKASDLILSVGARPALKVDGETTALNEPSLDSSTMRMLVKEVLDDAQKSTFDTMHELNLTVSREKIGRFRLNLYRQRGEAAMAVRYIPSQIPGFAELHLPPLLKDLVMSPRGLVLIVGASGSGKTTTLAAMIDYRNRQRAGHILTVEDPIEYLHTHDKSIVDQREIGSDTNSLHAALQNALRESPDVIVIGEIRDRATMERALAFASTGHLCLATLHATNAAQALDSVLRFFPADAREHVLFDLANNLRAIVSQRLLRLARSGGRVPAFELLLRSTRVSELIAKGDVLELHEAMKQGADEGMLTFEDSLLELYKSGEVNLTEALAQADSTSDLKLRVRLTEPLTLAPKGEPIVAMPTAEESGAETESWIDDKERRHRP